MTAAMVTAFDLSHFLLVPMPRGRAGPRCHGNKWEMLSLEGLGLSCSAQESPVLCSLMSPSTRPLITRTAIRCACHPHFCSTFVLIHTSPTGSLSHVPLLTLKSMPCLRIDAPLLWGLPLLVEPWLPHPHPRHSV